MDMDEDPFIQDLADKHGLYQSFPVVAPLSYKRLGPQDIQRPQEFVEKEQSTETWQYTRDRAHAEVAHGRQLASRLKVRATLAERAAEAKAARGSEQAAGIERSVDERRKQGDEILRAMEARVQEWRTRKDEVEIMCSLRAAEGQAVLEAEVAETAEVQKLIVNEQAQIDANWQRVKELEVQSADRVAVRAAGVERERELARKRIADTQEVVAERERRAEERYAAELKILQDELEAAKARCKELVVMEASRKNVAESEATRRREAAVSRLGDDQRCMGHLVSVKQDDYRKRAQVVEQRVEKTRAHVEEWQRNDVAKLYESASERSRAAHQQELLAKKSLEHSMHTLGLHFATHKQFTPTADVKISEILQGCLHAVPEVGAPFDFRETSPLTHPSARALPPPAPLSRPAFDS